MTAQQPSFAAAIQHFQAGGFEQAEQVCRALIEQQAGHVDALHMLGMLLSRKGQLDEAAAVMLHAVNLRPRDGVLCNNLGECLRQQDRLDEAAEYLRRAIALQGNLAEAHYNLGIVLKAQGQGDASIAAFRRAIELRPNYARAHYNLGNSLREEGRIKTAVGHYQRAIELQPDWADAHLNFGATLFELGELAPALSHLHAVQRIDPAKPDVDVTLGHIHMAQGDVPQAVAHYRRACEQQPQQWLPRLRADTLCEVIAPNHIYSARYQASLESSLDRAITEQSTIALESLHSCGAEPPMSLAYHVQNVRPMMERYAELFAERIKPLELSPLQGKPRVGIVVTHGHEGVFARCWGGIVERLSRARMHVMVVCSRAGANVLKQLIRIADDEYFVLPERLDQAAQTLRDAKFDLLHYWEIGTDSTNYFLPYFRPAAVQFGNWGWPVTSGNSRVDHFVSCDSIETADADGHFRESLVRMRNLPTFYERPELPRTLDGREKFGLSQHEHLYLCAQNLRKLHPDFDVILLELLTRDPLGRLLLIADAQPTITQLLLARLRRTMPAVCDRVQVLPRLERPQYLNLLQLADVALDTLHYGGGANTVYDAVSVGTPMISLPSPYQRGRWTLGVYKQLGLEDRIARSVDEYLSLAHRCAVEPDFRRSWSTHLLSAGESLFADRNVVLEHEELFLRIIHEQRS